MFLTLHAESEVSSFAIENFCDEAKLKANKSNVIFRTLSKINFAALIELPEQRDFRFNHKDKNRLFTKKFKQLELATLRMTKADNFNKTWRS